LARRSERAQRSPAKPPPTITTRGAGSGTGVGTMPEPTHVRGRSLPHPGLIGLGVHLRLGDGRQLLVGLAFLVQRLLEELRVMREAEPLRVRTHGAVRR